MRSCGGFVLSRLVKPVRDNLACRKSRPDFSRPSRSLRVMRLYEIQKSHEDIQWCDGGDTSVGRSLDEAEARFDGDSRACCRMGATRTGDGHPRSAER